MTNTEIFTRNQHPSLHLLTKVVVLSFASAGCLVVDTFSACQAQEKEVRANWKTGGEFHRQMRSLVGVSWGGSNTLRRATNNLAQNQGVAIFLDRRVDPDQEINFAVQNTELWTLLQQLAAHVHQGVCQIGPAIYIGPPRTAYVLATVAALKEEEVMQLADSTARRLQRSRRLSWPELTTPRDLLPQLGDAFGVQIDGIEQIPHDLWPAGDLPPLDFAQQMTLILAGFDLTFSFGPGGSQVRLVQLPETAGLKREYQLPNRAVGTVDEIRRRFPKATVTANAGIIQVDATVEEHELIRQLISGRPAPGTGPRPPAQGDVRYKLAIENKPIGGVAAALAKNLEREVRFDPSITNRLNDLVSFQVQDATLDELLRAFLGPAGLSYQIDEKTLLIVPGRSD